ncbi:BRAP2 RING ZnF UBP domain-containing protein [Drosera capensis]
MFTIQIHSVDDKHLLTLSSTSSSTLSSSFQNPNLTERRGVIHLFRPISRGTVPALNLTFGTMARSTVLFIVAVPNYFSTEELTRWFGNRGDDVVGMVIVRNDGMEDRYSVLIRMANQVSAYAFYSSFNGKRFSPSEVELCHILFVLSVDYTELDHVASTPPAGYCELPTCPVCLERLDQDTSGIQRTLCDHSFQCSCASKWTYLSCQVCRLYQQQDNKPTCSVCNTSENLWICVICGFVGCGRYKEGHTIRHWKDTQHCYSLDLETQRVWDYVGDTYVHRLNPSRSEPKSVTNDSGRVSADGGVATSDGNEDSDINEALFSSKLEATMDEYNRLLATQLENQRQLYESLLAETRSNKENVIAEAVNKALPLKLEEAQSKLEKCLEEKNVVANLNQSLSESQEEYERKYKEVLERLISSVKSRNEKIVDLQEQIRDLRIYVTAQKTMNTNELKDAKGGSLLPVPAQQPSSSHHKRGSKSGRRRN